LSTAAAQFWRMCSKETCYVTMIQLLTSGAYRNSSKLAESKLASNVMLFVKFLQEFFGIRVVMMPSSLA
jgi:hypothetical protein